MSRRWPMSACPRKSWNGCSSGTARCASVLKPITGNGDTLKGLYYSWGLGTQRFADVRGNMGGMPKDGHFNAVGHLGEAYGLISTFAVDLKKKQGIVSLIGGFGSDPEADPGRISAHTRAEERILDAIFQHAILRRGDRN